MEIAYNICHLLKNYKEEPSFTFKGRIIIDPPNANYAIPRIFFQFKAPSDETNYFENYKDSYIQLNQNGIIKLNSLCEIGVRKYYIICTLLNPLDNDTNPTKYPAQFYKDWNFYNLFLASLQSLNIPLTEVRDYEEEGFIIQFKNKHGFNIKIDMASYVPTPGSSIDLFLMNRISNQINV